MYLLTKRFHPLNFVFAERYHQRQFSVQDRNLSVMIRSATDDIHHIEISDLSRPMKDVRVEQLSPLQLNSTTESSPSSLRITPEAGIRLSSSTGDVLLEGEAKHCFGQCGPAWLFQFKHEADMCFYGLGEKQAPFERSGQAYTFYNIDAGADHPREQLREGDYDPDYISIPYLIIKRGNTYIGLLLDCPYPAMIFISSEAQLAEQLRIQLDYPPSLVLGAEGGIPSLYCILGPSLAELTCKLQKLTGITPLPPLWALGYQQSRWGYKGDRDLFELADRFEEHEFPVDGLWLDIDYMDNFRVFTFDGKYLPKPRKTVAALLKRGFRVVPILDPGVKRDEDYPVYIDGKAQNILVKCAFLFPFFRNHTMQGSRLQEPWAYSAETLNIFRRYVRLRYHLMPYLYNLFMDHEENGQAILRPLFYDFHDSPSLPLSHIDDQFMVGPSVMQAPFIHESLNKRKVILPKSQWLDGETGLWVQGACKVLAGKKQWTTPIYFREGSLIPFQPGKIVNNRHDLNHIGLFCCIPPKFKEVARYIYRCDDGISFDY